VVASQSRQIREVVGPGVQLVRHDGNHEDRLEPGSMNIPRRLRSLCHWTNHPELQKEWARWRWVRYEKSRRGCSRFGQVVLYHGYDVGINSDELEGLQMAMACGGHSNLLTVRGHSHRCLGVAQAMRTRKVPLLWWYMNVGHLGPRHPAFMRRQDVSKWGHGMAVIELTLGDAANMQGRNWDAELWTFGGPAEADEAEGTTHPLQADRGLAAPVTHPPGSAGRLRARRSVARKGAAAHVERTPPGSPRRRGGVRVESGLKQRGNRRRGRVQVPSPAFFRVGPDPGPDHPASHGRAALGRRVPASGRSLFFRCAQAIHWHRWFDLGGLLSHSSA
jgi:hypothetical protein